MNTYLKKTFRSKNISYKVLIVTKNQKNQVRTRATELEILHEYISYAWNNEVNSIIFHERSVESTRIYVGKYYIIFFYLAMRPFTIEALTEMA